MTAVLDAAPAVPRHTSPRVRRNSTIALVAAALFLFRAVNDVGLVWEKRPLPWPSLTGDIAFGMTALAMIGGIRRWTPGIGLLVFASGWILTFELVGFTRFGSQSSLTNAGFRVLSQVACIPLGCVVGRTTKCDLRVWLLRLVSPMLAVSCVGGVLVPSLFLDQDKRLAGTFSHPNSAAAIFGLSFILSISLSLSGLTRWRLASLFLSTLGLLWTESIGALVASSLAAVAVVLSSRRLSPGRKAATLALTLGLGALIVEISGFASRLSTLSSTQSFSSAAGGAVTNSTDWRFFNWSLLIPYIKKHVWLGWGLGATDSLIQPAGAPAHSAPLQLLVETGIVGALAITCCLVYGSARIVRAAGCLAADERSWAIGMIVFMCLYSLASNLLGYTASVYFFAIAIGAIAGRRTQAHQQPGESASGRLKRTVW